jgi:hypothetical protein
MAKKVIKINTNPNKTPATKYPNPTAAMIGRQDYYENVVAPDAPPRKKGNIKVSSNPATGAPGKTRIGKLAGGFRGGIGGGGMNWQTK